MILLKIEIAQELIAKHAKQLEQEKIIEKLKNMLED